MTKAAGAGWFDRWRDLAGRHRRKDYAEAPLSRTSPSSRASATTAGPRRARSVGPEVALGRMRPHRFSRVRATSLLRTRKSWPVFLL